MNNYNLRKYLGIVLFFLLVFIGQWFALDTILHLLLHFVLFRVVPEGLFIYFYGLKGIDNLRQNLLLLFGLSVVFILIYLMLPLGIAVFIEKRFIDLIIMHVIIVLKNPIAKSNWTYPALILAYFLVDVLSIIMRK